MTTSEFGVMDRRMAIGGVLAGAAGLALPRRQGRPVVQRGMVGGGLVRFEQGEANFSLFASRMIFAENEELVLGSILWMDDSAGLMLRSTAVTNWIAPEQERSRRILGMMSVNGEGEYPFELEVTDADQYGSSDDDRANLTVGDGARTGEFATPVSGPGFSYKANGKVVTGDLQQLHIEIDVATGAVRQVDD